MKISFKDFDIKDDNEYNYFTHLYNLSFPIEERRPISNIYYLLNNNKKYSAKLIINEESKQLLGFLCYWTFDDFIFAEHLAIDSSIRGVGIGTKTMKLFISETTKPLILEIEEPNTEITIKRLHFYQRLNFKYWEELEYAQPPYIENTDAVPMKLLTLRDLPLDTNYDFIKRYLYKHVYKVEI